MANYAGSAGAMNISNGGSVTVDGLIYAGLRGSTSVASISVGSGSSLTADGFLLINTGSELTLNGGTVTAGESGSSAANRVETAAGGLISGYGTLNSPEPAGVGIMDNGTIVATGGTLDITSNINGGGTLEIAANSTAMVTGATLHMPSIAFIGSDATLGLTHGSSVSSTISGFSPGDVITMEDISAVSFNPSNGVLTLSENGKFVESLHFAGSFTGDTFAVHQVGGGLAAITLQHG
jgi:hypothetical protein